MLPELPGECFKSRVLCLIFISIASLILAAVLGFLTTRPPLSLLDLAFDQPRTSQNRGPNPADLLLGLVSSGSPWTDTSVQAKSASVSFPGIFIHGSGSRRCTVGELCSFTIHVTHSATWQVSKARPLTWDLVATLEGPSLAHVRIEQGPTPLAGGPLGQVPGRTFLATYRVWDAGEYQVWLTNPCFTLAVKGVVPQAYQDSISLLGQWTLVVETGPGTEDVLQTGSSGAGLARMLREDRNEPGEGNAGGGGRGVVLSTGADEEDGGDQVVDACTETLQGRWVRKSDQDRKPPRYMGKGPVPGYLGRGSGYEWRPYPCATWQPLYSAIDNLAGLGVREVAFIGDSHLRMLLLHSVFLVTGQAPNELLRAHFDFSISLRVTGTREGDRFTGDFLAWEQLNLRQNRTKLASWQVAAEAPASSSTTKGQQGSVIRLSFYWVDGVFQNGEFGCWTRGSFSQRQGSFPRIVGKPDVAVLDSGAWTAFRCSRPVLAYSKHLNDFVFEMASKLYGMGCRRVLFYGSTPNAGCNPRSPAATNSLIAFQSNLAQAVSAHYGLKFFHTWEVVAPRYTSNCGGQDVHYSCVKFSWKGRRLVSTAMAGPVGEALSWTFFQFVLSYVKDTMDVNK